MANKVHFHKHFGNARWAGRVEVKNGHFYMEKGDFGIF